MYRRSGVSTETCQNLTFEAVCKDAVRGLVRTESGVLAQVSAGRLAPWLARKQGAGKQRGKQEIGRLRGLDRAGGCAWQADQCTAHDNHIHDEDG